MHFPLASDSVTAEVIYGLLTVVAIFGNYIHY